MTGGIVARPYFAFLAGLVLLFGLASKIAAQEPTASAGAGECTVEPYDLTTVLVPTDGTPVAAPTSVANSIEPPSGEPADDEVVEAVTETVELFFGCVNQGYFFRVLYLFTPEYLQRFVDEEIGPLSEEDIQQLAALAAAEQPSDPRPADEQLVIVSIDDVEVLEDGRVVATVIGDDRSQPEGPSPVYFLFEEHDGRYLIDDVIDPQPNGATPEP